jgi:predicted Rossmann fold nucleotide-binding protein DprA/Smf involved in DNA uptake
MRLAIIGSRSITSVDLDKLIPVKPDLIVSGGAAGVDSLGEAWARKHGIKTHIIKPNWAKYGRSAGFKRNPDIVDAADEVLAIWDGVSKGTMHTVAYARSKNKPVRIVTIPQNKGANQ